MKLNEKEAKLFYDIMFPLLDYINDKLHINPYISDTGKLAKADCLNPAEVKEIMTALWDDVSIIDEYVSNHELSNEEKEIILGWKKAVTSRFVIERHLKKGTILIDVDNQKVCLVQGIYSSWDEMLPLPLPIMVHTTLIPFKGKIISDGLPGLYQISFGNGMKQNFRNAYMIAKNTDTIIKEM